MVIMLPTVKGPIIKGFDSDKIKAARYYRVIWSPTPIPNCDKINEGDWFIGDNISLQQCTLNR
jgi:hypothetical protein